MTGYSKINDFQHDNNFQDYKRTDLTIIYQKYATLKVKIILGSIWLSKQGCQKLLNIGMAGINTSLKHVSDIGLALVHLSNISVAAATPCTLVLTALLSALLGEKWYTVERFRI